MKKIALLALLSFNAFAADFDCRYFYNLAEVHRNDVSIAEGAKDVVIAEIEEYRYFMTSLKDGRYELQALNVIEPSRTYATARITADSREIGLVIWKREQIIEVSCTLR